MLINVSDLAEKNKGILVTGFLIIHDYSDQGNAKNG